MTTLLWQTALLLLGAYFLGAWTACIARRILHSSSRGEVARPGVMLPAEAALGPPPPPQRLAEVEPVAPRIEPIEAAVSARAAAEPAPPSQPAPAAQPSPAVTARAATAPAERPAPGGAPAEPAARVQPPAEPTAPVILPAAATTSGQSSTSAPVIPPTTPAADDLTRIRGIDQALSARLRALNVRRYADIATWRAGDVERVSEALGFEGRIERDNWIEQAQILAAGGDTHFSRRLQRGEVPSAGPTADEGEPPPAKPAAAPARPEGPRPESDGLRPTRLTEAIQASKAESEAASRAHAAGLRSVRSEALRGEAPSPLPGRAAQGTQRDDLKRIRGIGVLAEKRLNALGITTYEQIAKWTRADIERVSSALDLRGRIERENWVEQAQMLAAGGETHYSRRLQRGEIPSAEPSPDGGEPPATATSNAGRDAAEPAESARAVPPASADNDSPRRTDVAGLRSVRSEALVGDAASPAPQRAARGNGPDDLKRIRGIGVLIEKKLNALGISTYEQVANWTAEDIERVSRVLEFKGRIEREKWVEQARILASGGQTEYARRIERGMDTGRGRLP